MSSRARQLLGVHAQPDATLKLEKSSGEPSSSHAHTWVGLDERTHLQA